MDRYTFKSQTDTRCFFLRSYRSETPFQGASLNNFRKSLNFHFSLLQFFSLIRYKFSNLNSLLLLFHYFHIFYLVWELIKLKKLYFNVLLYYLNG